MNKSTYLRAYGLFQLAVHYRRKLNEVEQELFHLLDLQEEDSGRDHISDEIWDSIPDFNRALTRQGLRLPSEEQMESPRNPNIG